MRVLPTLWLQPRSWSMPRLPCKRWHFCASNGDDDDLPDKRVSVPLKAPLRKFEPSFFLSIETEQMFLGRCLTIKYFALLWTWKDSVSLFACKVIIYSTKLSGSRYFYSEIIINVAREKFMILLLLVVKNRVFIPKWNSTKRTFSPSVSSIVRR